MQAEAEKLRTKSKYDKFDKLKRDGGDGVSTDYMQLAGEIITRRKEFEALLDEVQMNVRDVHADDPQDEQDDIVVDMLNDRIRETFDSMSLPHEWKRTGVAVKIPGVVVNLLRDPQHLPKRGEDVAEVLGAEVINVIRLGAQHLAGERLEHVWEPVRDGELLHVLVGHDCVCAAACRKLQQTPEVDQT